jgi:hypothetical protein
VTFLPEAATILFSGGFPRSPTLPGLKAIQRSIYCIQKELERMVQEEGSSGLVLCDRGVLDGLAHWPGSKRTFFEEMGASREEMFQRYELVIHLRSPEIDQEQCPGNPYRRENQESALSIDHRIERAWTGHPHRVVVERTPDFLETIRLAERLVSNALPACCQPHLTCV